MAPRKTKRSKTKAPKRSSKASRPKRKPKARRVVARAKKTGPKRPTAAQDRMKAFASRALAEEAEPVNVRSFTDARAGIEVTKQLHVRTGDVRPVSPMEPLTGPAAVPKATVAEEFQLKTSKKKPTLATREDFGPIELRMQRGSGSEAIGRAQPDNLQRSFARATESGRVAATSSLETAKRKSSRDLQVPEAASREPATLADFGEVEIAQQTRRGTRKLGTLSRDEETKE